MVTLKQIRLSDALPVIAFGACIALMVTNIQLHRRNAELNRQIDNLEASDAPVLGSHISVLAGTNLDGKAITLDLSHRNSSTLLFILSPSCAHCARTLPTWKAMMDVIGADHVVIGDLSGSLNRSYLKGAKMDSISNILHLNVEEGLLHGLRATPTPILLSKDGTVNLAWAGEMDGATVATFRRALLSTR